jgi:hypothetical protein
MSGRTAEDRWYLRSLADQDTHHRTLSTDGIAWARCGVSFAPRPMLQVIGPPQGRLIDAPPALRGYPKDPDQVCPQCQRDGGGTR